MKTKLPHELEIGDCFSYVGSFKIYQVQTKPEIDPEFDGPIQCPCCKLTHHPFPRLIFEVTDGKLRDHMGIRLRSDMDCTIHESLGSPLK